MQYRKLGCTGLEISALSLGSYVTFDRQIDVAAAKEMLARAYGAGVNFFDNAESYELGNSERIMGQAIEELGWSRDSFMVSSKVYFGCTNEGRPTQRGLHRKHVVEACHQALERLRVDHLDLYFCHRPDPKTPIEVTVRAMHDLVQQGKVLYWGTSEWSARQIREAFAVAQAHHLTPPSMEQPQYNMVSADRMEVEYSHICRQFGIGTTIWGPLNAGILTGKYADGGPADARLNLDGWETVRQFLDSARGRQTLAVVAKIRGVAERLGTTLPKLAIAWCLKNPHVSTVILGASRPQQLDENLASLDLLPKLDGGVMAELARLRADLPKRRLFRIPGARRALSMAHALGLR